MSVQSEFQGENLKLQAVGGFILQRRPRGGTLGKRHMSFQQMASSCRDPPSQLQALRQKPTGLPAEQQGHATRCTSHYELTEEALLMFGINITRTEIFEAKSVFSMGFSAWAVQTGVLNTRRFWC